MVVKKVSTMEVMVVVAVMVEVTLYVMLWMK